MPYRPDGDFLQDDDSRWDVEPQEPEGGAWWKWAVAGLSLALFGGVIWYAYHSGGGGPIGPVRTVEADTTPYKAKPENPGGEIIPDQDKLVFNEAVGRTTDTEDILGDQAEQPVAKPESVPVRKFVPPKPPAPPPQPEVAAPADTAPAPVAGTPPIIGGRTVAAGAPAPVAATGQPAKAPAATLTDPAKAALPDPRKPGPVIVQQLPPTQATPPAAAPEVKAAEPPKVTEAKPAGPKSPVVQLGAYGSEAGALESWAQVQRKQASIVSGLSPQVVKFNAPGKGDLYRLVIGPFADRGAAAQTCEQLKANGRDCIVNAN